MASNWPGFTLLDRSTALLLLVPLYGTIVSRDLLFVLSLFVFFHCLKTALVSVSLSLEAPLIGVALWVALHKFTDTIKCKSI